MNNKFMTKVAEQLNKRSEEPKHFGKYITVFYGKSTSHTGDIVDQVSINWAAIGSVSVEEAEQFKNDLEEAIAFANDEEAKTNITEKEKTDDKNIDKLKVKLTKMIDKAIKREENDDHLSDEERQEIVDLYRKVHPEDTSIPADMTDAYIEITLG